MLDFTSALYLGMKHGSGSLGSWKQLTTGAPAALEAPPGSRDSAQRIARLIGCGYGILGTSTLHLFWDYFGVLGRGNWSFYADRGIYPIARFGIERAKGLGAKVEFFPHYDPGALTLMVERDACRGVRPVIVTDGLCPSCGKVGPLPSYLRIAKRSNGLLIIDDTQALGILGTSPCRSAPFGRGGGGTLRFFGITNEPGVVIISSLAKGFGVPAALMAGDYEVIKGFEEGSETRFHCSPPSIVAVKAAQNAFSLNERYGDKLRERLLELVLLFKRRLAMAGMTTAGGLFPVQTLKPHPNVDAVELHSRLLARGVKAVLQKGKRSGDALLSFIITISHTHRQINTAVDILTHSVRNGGRYELSVQPGVRAF